MNNLFISNIEVIADQLKPIYCVGYVIDEDQEVKYKTYQLKDIIGFVHDNYRIDGVSVVKSETIAGQVLDKQHIIDYIENHYAQIIRRMLRKEIIKGEQDNVN